MRKLLAVLFLIGVIFVLATAINGVTKAIRTDNDYRACLVAWAATFPHLEPATARTACFNDPAGSLEWARLANKG